MNSGLLLLLIPVFLTGCASIMSGSTDQLTINSSPTGAEFFVKDENGKSVHHGTTPATLTLERGDGFFDAQTYDVDFSSPGYITQTLPVSSSLNGWYFGNIIFGGILGLLIIDPATGAMWSLPDDVRVNLTPSPGIGKGKN